MTTNLWPRVKISNLCELIVDCVNKTAPSVDYETPYKMIRTPNIKNGKINLAGCRFVEKEIFQKWIRRATVERGDVLLTREAPMGEVGYVNFEDTVFLGQRIMQYRVNPQKLDSDYLLYAFLSPDLQSQFRRHDSTGSIVSHIRVPDCSEFEINTPPINEQRKISKVLRKIDDKIELNNSINSELESMAKTLYDYWFVQFDFPDANGKPYKSSGGKMAYNQILKREIPEGWVVTTVGSIGKTELGGTPSTAIEEYWKNADIPWLSSGEMASFPIITSEQKITQAGIDNSAAVLLPKGTVVISIVRYIRPSILGIDATTNQSVVGIRECGWLKSSFIYPYFCSEVPRLMGLRTGAQQPHINKGVIDESPIVIPPLSILNNYYKVADLIFEKIMNVAFQKHELIKLRDWLLPMLMNGQVTVK
ncbi:restriction endonuclease subunit S [Xenorhabdus szentirmaii]|uniref:Restriction modification system DNA specificity domain n=1 Tax=Xenorhabdus szentirmaii DSM 16338 TaxID=1427518 RepID=W1J3E1_9GAMM|nr:restriction endonuclease subunit S [Xenorhabdus szentirmaii]PHM34456.1 type I restriction-modification enzyme subunit S [Xenorhabdus szentirmaii DSM 16338]PHM43185.1 type I restriction-modification enzyme subunit S [Xenorhabdus szentirmaii]CDL83955.1 Restriction modification system DNA specificity domain [Xenorhabdus szentirmaii DSM 16338]